MVSGQNSISIPLCRSTAMRRCAVRSTKPSCFVLGATLSRWRMCLVFAELAVRTTQEYQTYRQPHSSVGVVCERIAEARPFLFECGMACLILAPAYIYTPQNPLTRKSRRSNRQRHLFKQRGIIPFDDEGLGRTSISGVRVMGRAFFQN